MLAGRQPDITGSISEGCKGNVDNVAGCDSGMNSDCQFDICVFPGFSNELS